MVLMAEEKEPTEAKKTTRRGVSQPVFLASIALAVVVSFAAGMRSEELYRVVAPVFGVKVAKQDLDTAVLKETYRALTENYDGELDAAKLSDGAARGMVAAAGDKYTAFMDQDEAAEFQKDLNGDLSGIGAEIGVRNDQPTVLRVLDDSPAAQAGLQKGDVFVEVNGDSMDKKTAADVAQKVRGDTGTTVKLVMRRGGENKEYSITRAQVNDVSVRWSVADGIGTMIISRFDEQTGNLARRAAQEFADKRVAGVILDLRDNSGGYLSAAREVSGLWLNDKVVVTEKAGSKIIDTVKTGRNALLENTKTVVLVNGNSASASEIVAGALQDYDKAALIGEKTYGKGTVQKIVDLSDRRILKVTVARWYTPKGKNITEEGITPSKTVSISKEDSNAGRDPQMTAAQAALAR